MSSVDTINNVNHIYIAATKNHKTKGLGELNSTFSISLCVCVCLCPFIQVWTHPFVCVFCCRSKQLGSKTCANETNTLQNASNIHYWILLIVVDLKRVDAPFGAWVCLGCSMCTRKVLSFWPFVIWDRFFRTIVHNNGNNGDTKTTRYHKHQTRRASGKTVATWKHRDMVWIIRETENFVEFMLCFVVQYLSRCAQYEPNENEREREILCEKSYIVGCRIYPKATWISFGLAFSILLLPRPSDTGPGYSPSHHNTKTSLWHVIRSAFLNCTFVCYLTSFANDCFVFGQPFRNLDYINIETSIKIIKWQGNVFLYVIDLTKISERHLEFHFNRCNYIYRQNKENITTWIRIVMKRLVYGKIPLILNEHFFWFIFKRMKKPTLQRNHSMHCANRYRK